MTRIWVLAVGLLLTAGADPGSAADFDRTWRSTSPAVMRADGSVVRGDADHFSLTIKAKRKLSVHLQSREANAVFQIYPPKAQGHDPDLEGEGLPGAGPGNDATHWSGQVTLTGRYVIVVGPTRGNATYSLIARLD